MFRQQIEQADQMRHGGLAVGKYRRVERDMKMDAPFVVAVRFPQSDIEIAVAAERAVRSSRDDLVEVGVVGKAAQPFAGSGVRCQLQRGAEDESC